MAESQDEQRYYPNKFARIYLTAIEDLVGKNGLAAVLNLAGLGHLVDNYPPDDLNGEFSFDDFAGLNQAIEDIYGQQGARGLCLRAGRATFTYLVEDGTLMEGLPEVAFGFLPLGAKIKVALASMAEAFSRLSDETDRLEEDEDNFIYIIDDCPICWGRNSEVPICYGATGILQQSLAWASERQTFDVAETECIAKGDDTCTFVIAREPLAPEEDTASREPET